MDNKFLLYLLKTFKLISIAIISLVLIRGFIIEPGIINGRSMEPTYYDNNMFFINKFYLLFIKPKRGQIVQLYEPKSEHHMIKRIIGMPGDTLIIKSNKVYLKTDQGEVKLEESYIDKSVITKTESGAAETTGPIPEHYYFVMGDNRPHSIDSRNYGIIHRKYINGLVIN